MKITPKQYYNHINLSELLLTLHTSSLINVCFIKSIKLILSRGTKSDIMHFICNMSFPQNKLNGMILSLTIIRLTSGTQVKELQGIIKFRVTGQF